MARPRKKEPEHDRDFARMDMAQTLMRVESDYAASKSFQQPWLDKFVDYYKMYRHYIDPENFRDGRSHLFIPYVFHIIETEVPRLVNTLINVRPFVQTMPLGLPSPEREMRAKKMNYLLDYQFQLKVKFVNLITDVIKSALIYGTAVTRQGWRVDRREMKVRKPVSLGGIDTGVWEQVEELVTVYDDPYVRHVPIWDFFFDPSSTELDDARYCIEREWMDYSEIEQLSTTLGIEFKNMPELKRSAKGGNARADSTNPHLDAIARSSSSSGTNRRGIEVLHYWTPSWYVIVANREFVLSSVASPYMHGKLPYAKWVDTRVPSEWYAIGEVEALEDLQEELNVTRNQRIDNVSLVLTKMFAINRAANIDPNQLIARPGGFVEVDNVNEDIKELTFTDVTSSSYQEEALIKSDMDRVSGVHDTIRGSESSRRETATMANLTANAGAERFKLKTALIAYGGMNEMIQQVIRLNQQFLTAGREALILGKDGAMSTETVTPSDVAGEYDIVAVGSAIEPMLNLQVQQSNLTSLYSLLKDNPLVQQDNLLRNLFQTFGFKNIDSLMQPQQPPQPQPPPAPIQQQPVPMTPEQAAGMAQTDFEAGLPIDMGGMV